MLGAAVDPTALAPVAVVLAAMGGLLKVVLDFIGRMTEKHEKELEARDKKHEEEQNKRDVQWQEALAAHRLATETFLGNHMSGNTRALEALVAVVESLAAAVDTVTGDATGED